MTDVNEAKGWARAVDELMGRLGPRFGRVGGVGRRHRSPPVGVKATPTADRAAGSADGRAIHSRLYGQS